MIARRLAAELLGTAGLLLAIVGSGIVAATDGSAPAQLFQHAVVVGATLGALIVTFGSVSGVHFNPVTAVDAAFGGLFDLPVVAVATTERAGWALAASEGIATAGALIAWLFRPDRALAANIVVAVPGVRRHLRVRPPPAGRLLGVCGRLGLRGGQDRELGGDGVDVR